MTVKTNATEVERDGLKVQLSKLFGFEEAGILSALVVICIILAIFTENFLLPLNIIQVIRQASYFGIMAVGMVFVLSQGDVDLSVGAMFNLTAMIMARLLADGLSVNYIIPIGLLVGALLGLINGGLSILLDIPMIIITLGTISVYSALSLVVSGSTSIANFPKENWFFDVFGGKIFGFVPMSVILLIIVAIVGHILYNHTTYGRRTCAVGANREAARYAGINVKLNRLITMIQMGVICGIGGIGILGFLKAADPSIGKGSELSVISAAIIGGTSLFGGAGSIIGAVIGALIIAVIRNGLVLLNVSVYWQGAVTGSVIILAVTLDYFIKRRS
jgi:ribose transport system permease protein